MTGGLLKKAVHGGGIKQFGECTRKSAIDFSASLNPLPPRVDWIPDPDDLSCYPDDGYSRLKSAISRVSGRPEEEICVGNGSVELLRVFCAARLGPGSSFVTEDPTFGEYALSAEITGARRANPGEIPGVSFICNPNNPTGMLRTRSAMQALLKESEEQGTFLFLDEAFIELADTPESISDIRSANLFILRSLTKCFSVPGIRFGYGFGDTDLIETIELMRPPWSVNAFAESFAIAALQKLGDLESSREYIRRERERLAAALTDLGFSVT
ncbi:MAG: histidinol-phosphate transaminase, partial [Methanoregulaceae archaeon]